MNKLVWIEVPVGCDVLEICKGRTAFVANLVSFSSEGLEPEILGENCIYAFVEESNAK